MRESRIEGLGEFASAPIAADALLKRMGGRLIDDKEMQSVAGSGEPFSAYRVGPDTHLLMTWDDPASRGNHSCDPNCWLTSTFEVIARRDIAAGEELTLDYATMTVDPAWAMACACGTQLCRGNGHRRGLAVARAPRTLPGTLQSVD